MELREQRFGIEIEMTGITRAGAAKVAATYFGTRSEYVGTYYQTYAAVDQEGRQWKFMSDGSIRAEKKVNGEKRAPGAAGRVDGGQVAGLLGLGAGGRPGARKVGPFCLSLWLG